MRPAPTKPLRAGPRRPRPILLAAIAGFFVIYVGVELGFAGWIYAYGEDLEVGGVNGPAWLTATFWAGLHPGAPARHPAGRRRATSA